MTSKKFVKSGMLLFNRPEKYNVQCNGLMWTPLNHSLWRALDFTVYRTEPGQIDRGAHHIPIWINA